MSITNVFKLFVKQDPILDQFYIISRPYDPRLSKWLENHTFPAAHTHIANIWGTPPQIKERYTVILLSFLTSYFPFSLSSHVV